MHLIDLQGLPLETILPMRTVEIYIDNFSQHTEFFLDPTIQIHQSQGGNLFAHIAKSEFASRPDGLKPSSSRPQSLQGRPFRSVPGARISVRSGPFRSAAFHVVSELA